MEPITAIFSVTEEPDSVPPVVAHQAFFAAAVALMRGAVVLASAPRPNLHWRSRCFRVKFWSAHLRHFCQRLA